MSPESHPSGVLTVVESLHESQSGTGERVLYTVIYTNTVSSLRRGCWFVCAGLLYTADRPDPGTARGGRREACTAPWMRCDDAPHIWSGPMWMNHTPHAMHRTPRTATHCEERGARANPPRTYSTISITINRTGARRPQRAGPRARAPARLLLAFLRFTNSHTQTHRDDTTPYTEHRAIRTLSPRVAVWLPTTSYPTCDCGTRARRRVPFYKQACRLPITSNNCACPTNKWSRAAEY